MGLNVVIFIGVSAALLAGQCFCEAFSLKAGKVNVTGNSPCLFACETVVFDAPFHGLQQVKVFATIGHSVKSPTPRQGAAVWVEAVSARNFTVCAVEFGEGSNGTTQVDWIAVQSSPIGGHLGTASLNSWTTGMKCEEVNFPQRFSKLPTVLVTVCHQSLRRHQDAMAVWVEDVRENNFKICLQETKIFDGRHENIKVDWLAFTDTPENVTHVDSLVFTNINSTSQDNNYAFCKKINFTETYFASPVVVATPKHKHHNNNASSASPGLSAITVWVEYTSEKDTEVCMRNYNGGGGSSNDSITVDVAVIGDLDPCLNLTCHDYYGLCKAIGPHDARCVCMDRCPSYQEPVCSSNGTTYENKCLFEQEMCQLKSNFSLQHPGSCEGFSFQRGRRRMQNIPSMGDTKCDVIQLRPYVFYPDKPIQVQITINHIDTSDKSYVHDAAVSWVENVGYDNFTACVMVAGMNDRKSLGNVTVDWMAYQGAPVGGVAGEVRIAQWWTGTTCETVNFPKGKFTEVPSVFVTSDHHHAGLKRDAASTWLEDVTQASFKVCLRELQNYAGAHEDIYINWLVFSDLHKPLFSEHSSVYFSNSQPPTMEFNYAYCKDVTFLNSYNSTPTVIIAANHSSSGGNLDPVHNGITAWVEYVNQTGFRTCLKELYETRYDPLSVTFTVLSDICEPGWSYFDGYCYLTSATCASWLTAEANCSAMGSHLVTIHNQEENVYIQHRHNGERSWIGLNDRSVEGSFVWTNKEISSFMFWAPNQPNDVGNEDCVHTLGVVHGYTWNDVPCSDCHNYTCSRDHDECTDNSHSCDVNAVCLNTVGSYTCTCKVGYTGDGKLCTETAKPKSCSAWKKRDPSLNSGSYVIDPDGKGGRSEFTVTCDMADENGVGVTVISHDTESRTFVNGYEAPGSYSRDVHYTGASLSQLASLTSVSSHCEQFIKYECHHSAFWLNSGAYAWWVSRDSTKMTYWGGASPGSLKCACGMTNSCASPGSGCNCDTNDNVWRQDSGVITNKSQLPVSQLRFGDMIQEDQMNKVTTHWGSSNVMALRPIDLPFDFAHLFLT